MKARSIAIAASTLLAFNFLLVAPEAQAVGSQDISTEQNASVDEPKFGGLTFSKTPKTIRASSTSKSNVKSFYFEFKGPASGSYEITTHQKTLELIDYVYPFKLSKMFRTSVDNYVPYLEMEEGYITPGKYKFKLHAAKTPVPGKYRIKPTVTAKIAGKTIVKTKTIYITLLANKRNSAKWSNEYSWANRETKIATLVAPEYQYGAKVRLYCQVKNKKTGKNSWKKVATSKVKKGSTFKAISNIKISDKCNMKAKVKFKVGKTKYSPAYSTEAIKIIGL